MFYIAICEDDQKFAREAKEKIEKYLKENQIEGKTEVFYNGNELLNYMEESEPNINLVFLGVSFPRQSGVEFAVQINRRYPRCRIVFTAEDLSCYVKVYEARHFYFVLKTELGKYLERIFYQYFQYEGKDGRLFVNLKGSSRFVCLEDIYYLERGRRKSYLWTSEGMLTVHERFEGVCEELLKSCFVRCHNSFVVNINEIERIEAESLFLKNGKEISISRRYKKAVKSAVTVWAKN